MGITQAPQTAQKDALVVALRLEPCASVWHASHSLLSLGGGFRAETPATHKRNQTQIDDVEKQSTMAQPTRYGAVEADDNAAVDHSFDADNTYYLKDGPRLTPEQRRRKLLLVAVPILAAILIVGGAAALLLRDFNHLYPGRGGSSHGDERSYTTTTSSSSSSGASSPRGPSLPVPSPETTKKKSSSSGSSDCSANAKCANLNLTGSCCPTLAGDMLDCCN